MSVWTRWGALVPLLALGVPCLAQEPALQYPPAAKTDHRDSYFDTSVADPYRWMEDLNSPETTAWVAAENQLTFGYLDQLPGRDAIRKRLTELWDFPRVSLPTREAGRLFYLKNSGLQRQSVLYQRSSVATSASVLLDPNTLSPDGSLAFADFAVSPDGRLMAYALAQGGADLKEIHLRDLKTGQDLADLLKPVKFTVISWTRDGKGFFYSRYPKQPQGKELSGSNQGQQLFYHIAGTAQEQDRLIYERKDHPEWFVGGGVSEDGRYLEVYLGAGGTENRLYYADLKDPRHPGLSSPVVPLIDLDDAEYTILGNIGRTLYLRTDLGAPRRRIVALELPDTARAHWRTVVPEGDNVIEDAGVAGGRLYVGYLVDVRSQVRFFGFDGHPLGALELPGLGTVGGISSRNDTPELFYSFTSFLDPNTVFRYDFKTGRSTAFEAPHPAFDPSGYETKQVFYPSKDGTRIPMFVTARKGLNLDGLNPTLLYAYGGFDISILPFYSPAVMAWLEMGGVYAVPNLRGGGEYGEEWHHAGMLEKKQNVFDDFIGAAEYLIAEHYTTPERLAIEGGSNGGLLVGAVMTQRPELFAVALPAVGVMDMLRYQKFTGGAFWVPEYGSSDDSTAFQYLIRYSPLQNLKAGSCYPATLVTTADHDDRVVPSHSFKFMATLQAAQGCDHPTLIRVETEGSHGYRPTDKRIAEVADLWAFTAARLGLSPVPAP